MARFTPHTVGRLLRVAAACAVVLFVLGLPRFAWAALSVGMCGEHAESIAAPPISRAENPTTLSAVPCERRAPLVASGGAPERQPDLLAPAELIPRLPPLRYGLPPTPSAERAPRTLVRDGARPAHNGAVERPPR